MSDAAITSRIWNLAHVMRDDGVGYGDYLEQITYLLFLKMVDEYNRPPYNRNIALPRLEPVAKETVGEPCNWETLISKNGAELDSYYGRLLRALSKERGMLGQIFAKSQNRIQDPAKLGRIITMIERENWTTKGSDVKGKIYEGLLERNAEDVKSGAGQYFTPRPLINTMVKCAQPQPMRTVADPACGSGGFFLSAHAYISNNYSLNIEEKKFLKHSTFYGNEIVAGARRSCLMNMLLHGIGEVDGETLIKSTDALIAPDENTYDYVFANPPFGKKSSYTVTNEEGEVEKKDLNYNRQDFWETTSNKQLNFLQHIKSMLKTSGEAAVVLPDNVLFEGGAGEGVRKQLLQTTELHTILRLPTGIFYAQGVKANVLFFKNKPAAKEPWTKEVWIYDYRTNIHHTLKQKPLTEADLEDFVQCYRPENIYKRQETWSEESPDGRWRKFSYDEIIARDKTSLDIFWVKDESLTDLENLSEPDVIAAEIVENLESALDSLKEITDILI